MKQLGRKNARMSQKNEKKESKILQCINDQHTPRPRLEQFQQTANKQKMWNR